MTDGTNSKRRYLCRGCHIETKLLDGDQPPVVRTGCPRCETLTGHVAYGTPEYHEQIIEPLGDNGP